jgi:hypothetical protein
MFYAGIDAHMKSSTIWIVDRKGGKVSSSTVLTSADGFAAGLWRWAHALGLSIVEGFGSESRSGEPESREADRRIKKKADRVDAETLAELWRLGGLPKYISHRWKRAGCALS